VADETVTDAELEAFMMKLASVDLTDKERALLRGMVDAAAPAEVQGFDKSVPPSQTAATTAAANNPWAGLTPAQYAYAQSIMNKQH
jgi:hypothetical protein